MADYTNVLIIDAGDDAPAQSYLINTAEILTLPDLDADDLDDGENNEENKATRAQFREAVIFAIEHPNEYKQFGGFGVFNGSITHDMGYYVSHLVDTQGLTDYSTRKPFSVEHEVSVSYTM